MKLRSLKLLIEIHQANNCRHNFYTMLTVKWVLLKHSMSIKFQDEINFYFNV